MKVRVAPSCGIIGELRLSAANLLVKLLLQMLLLLITSTTYATIADKLSNF